MSLSNEMQSRIKVTVKKPLENPDNRTSIVGEPFVIGEDGRETATIPGHTKAYLAKMYPHYEFSEEFEIEKKNKAGRPPKSE